MSTTNQPTLVILDDEALAEIEARANAATAGPWLYDDNHSAVIEQSSGGESWIVQSWSKQEESFVDERENGEFIAHARTDIPALCQTVRALRAERLEIQQVLASTVLEDPTEDDDPPYSTAELVEGVRWLLRMKEAKQIRNTALREQLAEAREYSDTLARNYTSLEDWILRIRIKLGLQAKDADIETAIDKFQSRLAQVEKERDDYREQLLRATETKVEI